MKVLNSVELLKKLYDKLLIEVAKKNDITLMELKILMFLNKNKVNFAKDIVEGIKATKSHVSMAVCDLEEKNFIEKLQDEKDKKKYHLQLTEKSTHVIEEGKKVQIKVKEIMMQGLTKEELNILSEIALKIQNNLENYNIK